MAQQQENSRRRKVTHRQIEPKKEPQKKPDCHMGIFWGETSSENKMWSSSRAGNTVTEITMYNPIGKVYLFPVNGN